MTDPDGLRQIGWLYHFEPSSSGKDNDAFVWLDDYPEAPVDGCLRVFVEMPYRPLGDGPFSEQMAEIWNRAARARTERRRAESASDANGSTGAGS